MKTTSRSLLLELIDHAMTSNSYHRLRAECRKLIRDYEIKREENVIKANTTCKFYSFVNGKN